MSNPETNTLQSSPEATSQPQNPLNNVTPIETVDRVLGKHLDDRNQSETQTQEPDTFSKAGKGDEEDTPIDDLNGDDWQAIINGVITSNPEPKIIKPDTSGKSTIAALSQATLEASDQKLAINEQTTSNEQDQASLKKKSVQEIIDEVIVSNSEANVEAETTPKPKNANPPSMESLKELVSGGLGSRASEAKPKNKFNSNKGKKPRKKPHELTQVIKHKGLTPTNFGKHAKDTVNRFKDPSQIIDPTKDGVTHINVFANAKTNLGRQLDLNTRCSFQYSHLGYFESIGGLWVFLLSKNNDKYRSLYGNKIKRVLTSLERNPVENFKSMIGEATWCKVTGSKNSEFLIDEMLNSKGLPFKRYYVKDGEVVEVTRLAWYMKVLEMIRDNLIQNSEILLNAAEDESPQLVTLDFTEHFG